MNPFTNKPRILRVCYTGLLKTLWDKEKLLVIPTVFSHNVFYPFVELSVKFEIIVCKLSVWKNLKSVVWEPTNNPLPNSPAEFNSLPNDKILQ